MKYSLSLIIYILLFQSITCAQFGRGTSVLFIVSDDTISIAADSKRRYDHFDGTHENAIVNKIWNVGEIFFFMAGTTIMLKEDKNKIDTVFNAYKAMEYFIKQYNDIDNSFRFFNDSAKIRIKWVVTNSNKKKSYGDSLFDAGIAQMTAIGPRITLYHYKINKENYTLTPIKDDPPPDYPLPLFNGFGHYLNARQYAFSHQEEYNNHREILIKMIKLEIANDSTDVGEPIRVVSIYRGGHISYPLYSSSNENAASPQNPENLEKGNRPFQYTYLMYIGGAMLLGSAYYFLSKRMSTRKSK